MIIRTIRVTGLDEMRNIIAEGLKAMGHTNVDKASIQFVRHLEGEESYGFIANFLDNPSVEPRRPMFDVDKTLEAYGR